MKALTILSLGLVLASAVLLAACSTTKPEPVVRTVEVKVAVPVSCVPKSLGEEPAYPDTDAALRAAPSGAERYQLVVAGRLLRDQWLKEVRPVLAGCR